MQLEHDERAKIIAEQTLDALGEVHREMQVPTLDAQSIDLWFQRRRGFAAPLPSYLTLLDALFPGDAMAEAYSQAVSLPGVWESTRKQLGLRKSLQEGRRELVPPPWLWLISAGRPDAVFAAYDLAPRPGTPAGVYDFARGLSIGLIVIGELPNGKPTLLLRLMGSASVRRGAMAEITGLSPDDPDRAELMRIVAALRHTVKSAKNIDIKDREEFMTTAWAEFEQYEKGIRQEGQVEALRRSALRIITSRFGASPAVTKQIAEMDSVKQLEDLLVRLAMASTLDEALREQ